MRSLFGQHLSNHVALSIASSYGLVNLKSSFSSSSAYPSIVRSESRKQAANGVGFAAPVRHMRLNEAFQSLRPAGRHAVKHGRRIGDDRDGAGLETVSSVLLPRWAERDGRDLEQGPPPSSTTSMLKTRRSGRTISRKTPVIGCSAPSGARMTIRSVPPGRTSISQTGLVKPCGPHHCAMQVGSAQASNTNSRGASNTRVRSVPRHCRRGCTFRRHQGSPCGLSRSRPAKPTKAWRQSGCSQLIIHGVPNRSTSMPNRSAQKALLDRHPHGAVFR